MPVALRARAFDPWSEIAAYQGTIGRAGSYGATACFVGTMRDFNEGEEVAAMTLEHYPGMTEKHLEAIAAEAAKRWQVVDVLVVHRVGEIRPGEPIVLVAAWSAHRADAFAACRYLIEELKSRAPFWKKERLPARERWVEHNSQ